MFVSLMLLINPGLPWLHLLSLPKIDQLGPAAASTTHKKKKWEFVKETFIAKTVSMTMTVQVLNKDLHHEHEYFQLVT